MSSKPVRALVALVLSCSFMLVGEATSYAATPQTITTPVSTQLTKEPSHMLATTLTSHEPTMHPPTPVVPLALKAYHIAEAQVGKPYLWGAPGPRAFDCSGLTQYSYLHAGKALPRTAQDQYNRTTHISASSRKVGDLIFFGSTRSIYHVGFYAGNGYILAAPYTGAKVRFEKIWSSNVHYGRV